MAPLASYEDFKDRIPGGVSDEDEPRARALLQDATNLILAEGDADWTEQTAPPECVTICIQAAKRAFVNPDGVRSMSIDNLAASFSSADPNLYLTADELRLIRRRAGKPGLWVQQVTRSDEDRPDTPSIYGHGAEDPAETHITDVLP